MSSPPVKYQRYFDFTTYQSLNPDKPLPGAAVDQEFNRLLTTTTQTIDRLALIQRDDGKLKDGAITTDSLLDGSVTEPKLATGAVSTRALGFASVDNTKLAPNAVTESTILNQNVTTPKLADGSVTSAKLAANITLPPAANIQINSLGVGMAAPLTPGGLAVAGLADLYSNARVRNNLQVDGAMGVNSVVHLYSTLAVDGISTLAAKLNVTAGGVDVTGASIFRSAVQFLAGLAINGLTVTGAVVLPDNSITSAMIADLSIGTADLAALSVTNPKIGPLAVDNSKLALLSVATSTLQDASVTLAKLAPNSVDSSKILDGSIDPADLSASTIALISSPGNPRGQWLTGINYLLKDSVTQGSGVYVCLVAHMSGVFATDLAAGKWLATGQVFDQSLNKADSAQFAKLWLGGVTAAFPMLVNSGAELHAKLGDNSSYATVRAQNFVAQGSQFYAGGGTSLYSPSDSIWRLLNGAGTDFNMLQFGGGTALFPALRRIGTELQSVKSDISDYAAFTASSYNVNRIGAAVVPVNGMFLSGVNQVGWSANSNTVMTLDTGLFHCAPLAQFDGFVGIGMSPVNVLDITRNVVGTAAIKLLNNAAGNSSANIQAANGAHTVQLIQFGTTAPTVGLYEANVGALVSSGVMVVNAGASYIRLGVGNAEQMRVAANYVSFVNQPRFSAYFTGDKAATAGSYNNLAFDAELFDVGNNFNTGNGRFTAPVSATYHFDFGVATKGTSDSVEMEVFLSTTTTSYYTQMTNKTFGFNPSGMMCGSVQVDLIAGQQAWVTYYNGGTGTMAGGGSSLHSFFTGKMVA